MIRIYIEPMPNPDDHADGDYVALNREVLLHNKALSLMAWHPVAYLKTPEQAQAYAALLNNSDLKNPHVKMCPINQAVR